MALPSSSGHARSTTSPFGTCVRQTFLPMRSVRGGVAPTRHGVATAWRSEGAHLLVEAVNSVGDCGVDVSGGPRPALGSDYHLPPALALDGITEWLVTCVPRNSAGLEVLAE